MPNHEANAKFLIELAEKGRSFKPHTPKRYSEVVGLFWILHRQLQVGRTQTLLFHSTQRCVKTDWGCSLAQGEILIGGFYPETTYSTIEGFTMMRTEIPGTEVSPLAMLRLYLYFLRTADDLGIIQQWSDVCARGRSGKQTPPQG